MVVVVFISFVCCFFRQRWQPLVRETIEILITLSTEILHVQIRKYMEMLKAPFSCQIEASFQHFHIFPNLNMKNSCR